MPPASRLRGGSWDYVEVGKVETFGDDHGPLAVLQPGLVVGAEAELHQPRTRGMQVRVGSRLLAAR